MDTKASQFRLKSLKKYRCVIRADSMPCVDQLRKSHRHMIITRPLFYRITVARVTKLPFWAKSLVAPQDFNALLIWGDINSEDRTLSSFLPFMRHQF